MKGIVIKFRFFAYFLCTCGACAVHACQRHILKNVFFGWPHVHMHTQVCMCMQKVHTKNAIGGMQSFFGGWAQRPPPGPPQVLEVGGH